MCVCVWGGGGGGGVGGWVGGCESTEMSFNDRLYNYDFLLLSDI